MKKIFNPSLFIVIVIAFFTFFISGQVFAGFVDVPSRHANFDAVQYVKAQNIVKGYEDGTYKPDRKINRAEFTKIVIGAGFSEADMDDCMNHTVQPGWSYVFFPDIPKSNVFAKWICLAKREGIIKGYADGTFKPNQEISFIEAAKIIANTFNYQVASTDPWYKGYSEKLSTMKAIPLSIDTYNKSITRGEMAEMIYRLKSGITNKLTRTYNQLMGLPDIPKEPEPQPFVDEPLLEEEFFEEEPTLPDVPEPEPEPTVPPPAPEPETHTFNMTAERFKFSPSQITVNQGDTVKLNITASDVTHGILISEFGISEMLAPDETVLVEFVATKKGTFPYICSVFCGSGHGSMKGTLVVQ